MASTFIDHIHVAANRNPGLENFSCSFQVVPRAFTWQNYLYMYRCAVSYISSRNVLHQLIKWPSLDYSKVTLRRSSIQRITIPNHSNFIDLMGTAVLGPIPR